MQSSVIFCFDNIRIKKIKVKKKPNILFFSTGNEITNKDKIYEWEVRNSNCHYINSLSQNFLFNFKNGGIIRDNQEANLFLKKLIKCLNQKQILIITSGAVSAGKFDYIPRCCKNNLNYQIISKVYQLDQENQFYLQR